MSEPLCRACGLDAEARDARCSACPCVERSDLKSQTDRSDAVMKSVAAVLCLGIDGTLDRDRAYHEAFTELYSHLYGPAETSRVLAEGKRFNV